MTNMNEFVTGWLAHRKVLHALLDTVEDEQLAYKPWDTAMSLSELALHISGAMYMFALTVKNGQFTPPPAVQSFATAQELKALIEAQTEQITEILLSLTSEQLDKIIDFKGLKYSGSTYLTTGKEHEIHHKGQLFIYLRLLGAQKLPFYVSHS